MAKKKTARAKSSAVKAASRSTKKTAASARKKAAKKLAAKKKAAKKKAGVSGKKKVSSGKAKATARKKKAAVRKKASKTSAARKSAVKKKATASTSSASGMSRAMPLGRPKVTLDSRLDLLFHKDLEIRETCEFLRVSTLRELEQLSPDEIITRLTAPVVQTVTRMRKALALRNRCLKGDEKFAKQFKEQVARQLKAAGR